MTPFEDQTQKGRHTATVEAGNDLDSQHPITLEVHVNALALGLRAAAKVIGISPRLLSSLTAAGKVPYCRIGEKRIVYPVAALSAWLAAQVKEAAK